MARKKRFVQEQIEEAKAGGEEMKEPKKTIFEKWGDKFRDFLDNAE